MKTEENANEQAQQKKQGLKKLQDKMEVLRVKLADKTYRIRFISVLTILAIAVAATIAFIQYQSPKEVAKRYVLAIFYSDDRKASSLVPYSWEESLTEGYEGEEGFFQNRSLRYDEEIDSFSDYYNVILNERKEQLEDAYGKYKVTVTATTVKERSAKKILSEISSYELSSMEKYGFDRDDVKSGCEVKVKIKIVGEDETERITVTAYLAKVGYSWKVLAVDSEY